jgi:hypothetical protein
MKASVAYYDLKILERQQQAIHKLKYLLEAKKYKEITSREIEILDEIFTEKDNRIRLLIGAMDLVQVDVED